MNKLFDNSHFIAMQFNKSNKLQSHLYGFKNYNMRKQKNPVVVFPNDDIHTWNDVLIYIEFLNLRNAFESISVACLSKELYCDIFGLDEQEYEEVYEEEESEQVGNEETEESKTNIKSDYGTNYLD